MTGPGPSVAFVRGNALNPFETQAFAGLEGFDVRAIGELPANYEVDLVPVPVTLLSPQANGRAVRVARRAGLPLPPVLKEAGMLRGLREAIGSADIVHAAETFIPFTDQCVEITRSTGARLVLTCWENIPFLYDDDPVMTQRKQRVRDAAAIFVAVTEPARDTLIAEGVEADRIRVVPAALNTDRFEPGHDRSFLAARVGIPADAPIVLFVGRMIREKGVTELVHAFSRVGGASVAPHLVLVGNGPQTARVKVAAEALGAADRVHLLEGQSYADMPRVFRSADVVVIPSLSTPYWQEHFGYVLAEAMASGRPLVTTRTGSIPHVVGDAAWLVDDYDIDGLTAAIGEMLTRPDVAADLGRRGRSRAVERYSVATVAPQLAAAYEDALSR